MRITPIKYVLELATSMDLVEVATSKEGALVIVYIVILT